MFYSSALEASRLELHWKKLCEQEKRSKERNRELLRDFDRVEQQAAVLDAKTQRLKAAKVQKNNAVRCVSPAPPPISPTLHLKREKHQAAVLAGFSPESMWKLVSDGVGICITVPLIYITMT